MSEPRCDIHGPYTPEQAAALVLGTWKPTPTGHLCPECRKGVAVAAKHLADRIDADAYTYVCSQMGLRA